MSTTSRLKGRVQLAFASALLTLLIVGAISYRGMTVYSESGRWVEHTYEVLSSLQDLLFTMENIESGGRGFVLTGERRYLEVHRASVLRAEQEKQRFAV